MDAVFDRKPVRYGPVTGNERIHEFLEREGRPEAAPILDWIEFWYRQLPPAKQPDIRGRLRSDDTQQFTSAYFELQMFAMLRAMEYEVTVEPALADGRYNPDFLAQRGEERFYLEATVCGQGAGDLRAPRNEEDAGKKIRGAFGDTGVDVHSHLWLQAEGDLNRTLSKKMVAKPFIDLLGRTTAAEVQESYEENPYRHQHRTEFREEFRCDDWTLQGILEPKLDEGATGHVWDQLGRQRATLPRRSERASPKRQDIGEGWGPVDGILVVAISICHSQYFWNDGDETRAITEHSTSGNPAAAWRGELKAINGILFVGNVSLGNEKVTRVRLMRNPERCLPKSLAPLMTECSLSTLTGGSEGVG